MSTFKTYSRKFQLPEECLAQCVWMKASSQEDRSLAAWPPPPAAVAAAAAVAAVVAAVAVVGAAAGLAEPAPSVEPVQGPATASVQSSPTRSQ